MEPVRTRRKKHSILHSSIHPQVLAIVCSYLDDFRDLRIKKSYFH